MHLYAKLWSFKCIKSTYIYCTPKVYSIPLVLIIGWRGSPKIKDEPQHNVKGGITKQILKLLNINFTILRTKKDLIKFDKQIKVAKKKIKVLWLV